MQTELPVLMQQHINKQLYLKSPLSSELGKRILTESVEMIAEIGLEHFTFKRLAVKLDTTESSLYRYFENKHKLLIYLTSYHWCGVEYRLLSETHHLSASQKLTKAVEILCSPLNGKGDFNQLDTGKLYQLIISESPKIYLTKEVDMDNEAGFFLSFKRISHIISAMFLEINPDFAYPNSLASMIVEAATAQKYFARHLPSICDAKSETQLISFLTQCALSTLKN